MILLLMRRSDFQYNLPSDLIAQIPLERRADSRLLCLDGKTGSLSDRMFHNLPELLHSKDLLVFNNTKVIPARLFGRKSSGGKVEILVERVLTNSEVLAHVKASKAPKPGSHILLDNSDVNVRVSGRDGDLFELVFESEQPVVEILDRLGHVPLPPYIVRQDSSSDRLRYQTVYAQHEGAVAAPTAGLHFDEDMMQRLKSLPVNMEFVTLHVGAGTFQPVRVDDLANHRMHRERFQVTQQVCDTVKQTREQGGRVVAVGTTSLRALEAASKPDGLLEVVNGETDIFIYPGVPIRCVDVLITNFHLPESTLLMLVSAFAGKDNIFQAYQHAIDLKYRFFSYGDAMFIERR